MRLLDLLDSCIRVCIMPVNWNGCLQVVRRIGVSNMKKVLVAVASLLASAASVGALAADLGE